MKRTLRFALLALVLPVTAFTTGGCLSAPVYHGPVTDHFDGAHFYNPPHETRHAAGGFLKWMLHRKHGVWHDHTGEHAGPPPPALVTGTSLRVTFVNHSTLLVQAGGINVLTDPVWSERAGPASWLGEKRKRAPGIRFEDLPKIDVVLVSHNHYDHLDLPTLVRLDRRDHPRVFVPLGNAALLGSHGVAATDLDWWNSIDLGNGTTLTCVPERHFSGRGASDGQKNLWGGFVLDGPAGRIFFAGDTGYGPHFAEIATRFPGLRVALLPIGSYEPRWFMKPVHENPADAVQAFADLRAAQGVAIHYGTFDQTDEGEDDPALDLGRALDAAGIRREHFRVLGFGEGIDVPR